LGPDLAGGDLADTVELFGERSQRPGDGRRLLVDTHKVDGEYLSLKLGDAHLFEIRGVMFSSSTATHAAGVGSEPSRSTLIASWGEGSHLGIMADLLPE
jgi:hypothetical protein